MVQLVMRTVRLVDNRYVMARIIKKIPKVVFLLIIKDRSLPNC